MPSHISTATFAALLGVTCSRVAQLDAHGIIQKLKHGTYRTTEIAKYCDHLRSQLLNGGSGQTLTASRAQWLKEKTRITQLERQRLEGELLDRRQMEQTWLGIVGVIRTKLLALPSRAAVKLGMARNAVEAQQILAANVREILEELANTAVEIEEPSHEKSLQT